MQIRRDRLKRVVVDGGVSFYIARISCYAKDLIE